MILTTIIAAAGLSLVVFLLVRRRRHPDSPLLSLLSARARSLPVSPPPLGLSAVYPLSWIYRQGDEWRGGLAALRLDTARGRTTTVDALLDPAAAGSSINVAAGPFVLYCLDFSRGAAVLLEMAPGADLLAEPFLDRGVRRLAGRHAAVVSIETLEAHVTTRMAGEEAAEGAGNPLAEGLVWVWSTGRCGSTLLHRVLSAAGVCSMSEPYWLEQLCRARCTGSVDDDVIRRLLRVCLLADARLVAKAWMPQARATAVNLKGLGHFVLDLARELDGGLGAGRVTHLFMYREMIPVVESLASVFHSASSPLLRLLLAASPRWTLNLTWPPRSRRLRDWLARPDLSLAKVANGGSHVGAWRVGVELALAWVDSLSTWLEVTESWPAEDKAALRMDEFIDPKDRHVTLAAVLRYLLGKHAALDNQAMDRCLEVFGVHSQAGSRMQRSSAVTGRRYLGPRNEARLRALLASVPDERVASVQLPHPLLAAAAKGTLLTDTGRSEIITSQ